MLDVSKCDNRTCPSRFECYRFMAEADGLQCYRTFLLEPEEARCDFFWRIKPGQILEPALLVEATAVPVLR